jgi:hypothetical protein
MFVVIYYLLFVIYYLLFITYYLLLIIYYLLFITYYLLLCPTYLLLWIIHAAFFSTVNGKFITLPHARVVPVVSIHLWHRVFGGVQS